MRAGAGAGAGAGAWAGARGVCCARRGGGEISFCKRGEEGREDGGEARRDEECGKIDPG